MINSRIPLIASFLIVTAILFLPPIHEGLHAMACEVQGGCTKDIGFEYHVCETSNFKGNNIELWYSFPYMIELFFLGLSTNYFMEFIRICKKKN